MSLMNKFADAEDTNQTSCVDTECNLISNSESSYQRQSSLGLNSKYLSARFKGTRLRQEKFYYTGALVFSATCLISVIVLFLTFSVLTTKYTDLDNVLAKLSGRRSTLQTGKLLLKSICSDESPKTDTCLTSTCFKDSQFQMNYLDQTIEACTDYLQLSCGSWFRRDNIERDHFTTAYEKMLQDISDLLIDDVKPKDSKMTVNLKKYYQSCIDQRDIELFADVNFYEYMTSEFGPWKMLLNAKSNMNNFENSKKKRNGEQEYSDMSFEEKMAKLTALRLPLLFRFISDEYNSSNILMKLAAPADFCIMQSFLPSEPETQRSFLTLMKNIRNHMLESVNNVSPTKLTTKNLDLKIEEGQIDFEKEVKEMLELANKLYFVNGTKHQCHTRGGQSGTLLYTIDQLNANLTKALKEISPSVEKFFDFKKYVGFLNEKATSKLDGKSLVSITQNGLQYFLDVFTDLAKAYSSDKKRFMEAFQNLIHFHSVYAMIQPMEVFKAPHLHVSFPIRYYSAFYEYKKVSQPHETSVDFFKQMYRIKPEQNCAQVVIDSFVVSSPEGRELQRLYLTKKFDVNIKKVVQDMLHELIQTTFEIVNRQSWIDQFTKTQIFDHINNMEQRIVFSDAVFTTEISDLNMTWHNKNYHNLTEHFILNKLMIKNKDYETEFDLLETKPIERIRSKNYVFDIFLANLLYLDKHNTLLMPAGVLADPIFNKENPAYLNMATIGAYMSHEIWHLVQEKIFAVNNAETVAAYKSKLDCLTQHYRLYVKAKYNLDIKGSTANYEQIADTFGFQASYLTYKRLSQSKAVFDPLLPGLSYTQDQLFFMRYSQGYCHRPAYMTIWDFDKEHAVHEYRAFQPLFHSEFSNVFKCQGRNTNKFNFDTCAIFE